MSLPFSSSQSCSSLFSTRLKRPKSHIFFLHRHVGIQLCLSVLQSDSAGSIKELFFLGKDTHRELIFNQICSHVYSLFKATASPCTVSLLFVCWHTAIAYGPLCIGCSQKMCALLTYSDLFIFTIIMLQRSLNFPGVDYILLSEHWQKYCIPEKSVCKDSLKIITGKDAPQT